MLADRGQGRAGASPTGHRRGTRRGPRAPRVRGLAARLRALLACRPGGARTPSMRYGRGQRGGQRERKPRAPSTGPLTGLSTGRTIRRDRRPHRSPQGRFTEQALLSTARCASCRRRQMGRRSLPPPTGFRSAQKRNPGRERPRLRPRATAPRADRGRSRPGFRVWCWDQEVRTDWTHSWPVSGPWKCARLASARHAKLT
jgi:hypothetical protein